MSLQLEATLSGHSEDRVWHAAWSPSGRHLATSGEDKVIRIWGVDANANGEKFACIATLEDGQSRTIRCCEWSPFGDMIASASFDGTVLVWEAQSTSLEKWDVVASLEGHENEVKSVAWSNDGEYVASCGRDKKVWVWEKLPPTGGPQQAEFECVAMLEGHTQDVKFVKWHPVLPVLFSSSYDNSIKIWVEDARDWYCAETVEKHTSTVWGITFNEKGSQMVTCSDDLSLILWQREDGPDHACNWSTLSVLKDLHEFTIYSVEWSYQSNYIVSAGADNSIVVTYRGDDTDGDTFAVFCTHKEAHGSDINCVRFNPNLEYSDMIVSTGDDGLVKIWRLVI